MAVEALGPIPEVDSDESGDKKEKKDRKSHRRTSEDIGAAATKSAERLSSARRPEKPEVSSDTEPVPPAEAPLDHVGEIEAEIISRELALAAKQANAEHQPADADDPEAAAGDVAVDHMLDEVIAGQDIEAAYQQGLAELGVEAAEEIEAAPERSDEALVFDRNAEATPADDVEDKATVVAGAGGGIAGPPPPTTGAGGSLPPFGLPGGPDGAGFGGSSGLHPDVAPPPVATPYKPPHQPEMIDDGGSAAGAALIGGIIGYLIGRRRGRIKTEKKLLPIQKKLKAEVVDLQWQLKDKESKLRRAAAARVRQEGPIIIERLAKRPAAERPVVAAPEQHRPAPEAHQLHGEQAPEHIGHMLMTVEARPGQRAERQAIRPEVASAPLAERPAAEHVKPPELPPTKRVETLNRAELLEYSQRIIVEGSSLRQIYETHLIGERGLRRLVAEHLRGGDLKKALRREIVEREIDFERDPALRDMAIPSEPAVAGASSGNAALNQLLERAEATVPAASLSEEAAFYKARANYETNQLEQHQQHRKLVDVGLAVIITVLIAVVITLYLAHR